MTHPDRLAAVATLLGMEPAPVTRCRVLEVGCGDGSNLIPMAFGLPQSEFTGIDLAAEPIAAGRVVIRDLELHNASLEQADLVEYGRDGAEFDYIIAHGVYSWVPPAVRDGLLELCRRCLSPAGVAFISYNAYPGRHFRQMVREMLLYHCRDVSGPHERTQAARGFLQFLSEKRSVTPEWQAVVDKELGQLLERHEGNICHDELADFNQPVYFREFAAHAGAHGLQYLGEGEPNEMFDPRNVVGWVRGGVIEREQYMDFVRLRSFRQTLLCRESVVVDRSPGVERMERLLFSAPLTETEDGLIEGLRRVRITALQGAVKQVASALGEMYPLPLSFEELLPYAGDRESARDILYGLMLGGYADIHVHNFPCEDSVTVRPKASRLARYQAAKSVYVTTAMQHVLKLDETTRRMIGLLDGTRDHAALAAELGESAEAVQSALEWLARMAVLEA